MNSIKSSIYYIMSDAIFSGMPILLLPILSYYLLPEEYGMYANMLILMNIYSIFIDFSSSGFYGVNFYSKDKSYTRDQVFINAIFLMIINTVVLFIITAVFVKQISSLLFLESTHIYTSLFVGFCISVNSLYLTKLRFYEKVISFTTVRIIQALIHSALAILFVIYFNWSWVGRYAAHFISILLIFPFVVYSERKTRISIDLFHSISKFWPHLLFGLTLLPHSLSSWIKTGLDRVLLSNSVSISANGIYATGFQLSILIALVGVGFNKAFSPIIYKNMSNGEYIIIRKLIAKFLIFNFLLIILALIFLPLVINFLLSDKYAQVLPIVPYIIVGQGFLNIYLILSNILFYIKSTLILSLISVFTALVQTLSLYLLIGQYAELGAAISFLVSSFFQMFFTALVVYKKANFLWR